MTLFSHTNFWCFHHLVLITQHAFATVKGSMPIKKRHLFLKMEPKSATDIMAIAASVVEIAIFVCDMLLEGVSPGLSTPRAYSLFFFFFFSIHLTPREVTSGETITYRRDSSFLKNHFPTLTRRPWGEWGQNSSSYMKYLVTDRPAWSLKKQDGDCRS